jgi:hypothetical protein
MYNLMGQALMTHLFNDWLGWFYPGYSGFHPQKKNEIDEKMVVFPRVLRFPPTKKRKKEFYFIFDFTFL